TEAPPARTEWVPPKLAAAGATDAHVRAQSSSVAIASTGRRSRRNSGVDRGRGRDTRPPRQALLEHWRHAEHGSTATRTTGRRPGGAVGGRWRAATTGSRPATGRRQDDARHAAAGQATAA